MILGNIVARRLDRTLATGSQMLLLGSRFAILNSAK